jgi:hypothetical protein
MDNLVLLCRRHHRFVHEGGYSVELTGETPCFRDRWGVAVPDVPRAPPATAEEFVGTNELLGIGGETCASGEGEEIDLVMTVDALREILRPRASPVRATAAVGA